MKTHQMTARDFNQNASAARRAANEGPVIVTDHGKPVHVLVSYDRYVELVAKSRSILDALADRSPEGNFDFELPPRDDLPPRGTPLDLES